MPKPTVAAIAAQRQPRTGQSGGIAGEPAASPGWRKGSLPCMADSSTQSIVIDATPARIAEAICDFARYPEWVSAVKAIEVLEEYEDGYASQVRFVIDAGVVSDEYILEYEYAEDISRIEWHLVAPSKVQKAQVGSYDIMANDDGTSTVTYTLAVDLSIGMLGMFRRKAEKMVMDTALRDLKSRVESQAER
jgi:ribosome-associated toxin RatA of RatAB toxin-antitoxin module